MELPFILWSVISKHFPNTSHVFSHIESQGNHQLQQAYLQITDTF
jgi:hypothetical protein